MYRRSFVQDYKVTFDEVTYANDVMFSVRTAYFSKKNKVEDKAIYCYIKGIENQLTSVDSEKAFLARSEVQCQKVSFLREHGIVAYPMYPMYPLYRTIMILFVRKYGFSCLGKYLKLAKKYKVPLFYKKMIREIISKTIKVTKITQKNKE